MDSMIEIILRCLYMTELLFFCISFTLPMPKRRHFRLRMVLAVILCMLPEIFWHADWSRNSWLGVVENLLLFALLCLGVILCYDCDAWAMLFAVTGAYAEQRICLHLTSALDVIMTHEFLARDFFRESWVQQLPHFLLVVVTWLVSYQIFTRKIKKEGYRNMSSRYNLVICVVTMVCMVAFNAVDTNYRPMTPAPINLIVRIYSLSCSLLTLFLLYSMFQLDKEQEERAVVRQLWEKEKKQLELSRDTVDMINMKCHDMKHMIAAMEGHSKIMTSAETEKLKDMISIYDAAYDTGNETLDLVLKERGLVCQKAGIRLTCMADGTCLSFLTPADLYSLLANALDNAIMAVREIPEEKRVIKVLIHKVAGMASICVENYYQGQLQLLEEDDLPATSQEDVENHGYGMKSMRFVAEQYQGNLSVRTQNNIFTLHVLLPAGGEKGGEKGHEYPDH